MYFKLNNDCFFIKGKNEGCIYNLSNNKLYTLNVDEQNIIEKLEDGRSIDSIELENGYENKLLKHLIEQCYGKLYEKNVFIEKIRFGVPENLLIARPKPTVVHNLFLQISEECNMQCNHCSDNNYINRKTGCKKWNIKSSKIEFEDYKKIIDRAVDLSCESIYIMGGEPLLNKHLLIDIIKYTKTISQIKNVFVCSNLYLLDNEVLDNITTEQFIIHVIADDDKLLSSLDNSGNTIANLESNIKKLQERNIGYFFNLLISEESHTKIEEIKTFYASKGGRGIFIDFVYDYKDPKYLEYILRYQAKELCESVNDIQFYNNTSFHPCLNGKLSVFSDGDISTCPMMKGDSIGNIKTETLTNILEKNLHKKYWNTTLSLLDSCKECGYRFACSDCRALENSVNKNNEDKTFCCKEYITVS